MTSLAFRATYSDLKLIKTRQCVQIVFELPLADFDAAYTVLGGMPNSASETWFAIAPLKLPKAEKENAKPVVTSKTMPATPQPKDKPAGAKRDWQDVQPSAQASMLCDKPVFQAFLREKYSDEWVEAMSDPDECVRLICAVESKSMLNDGAHRVIWHTLQNEYSIWQEMDRT